jgi:hypothetical protein
MHINKSDFQKYNDIYSDFKEQLRGFLTLSGLHSDYDSHLESLPLSFGFYSCGQPFINNSRGSAITYSSHLKTYYSKDVVAMYLSSFNAQKLLSSLSMLQTYKITLPADISYIEKELSSYSFCENKPLFSNVPPDDSERTNYEHKYSAEELNFKNKYNPLYLIDFIHASKAFHACTMLLDENGDFLQAVNKEILQAEKHLETNEFVNIGKHFNSFLLINKYINIFLDTYMATYNRI